MPGAVDFSQWVAPDLELTLGARTYTVPAPSLRRAQKIIAAAVRAEVNLGIVKGEVPAELVEILATVKGVERPGLGSAAQQMIEDDVPVETIDRMEYYAIFYWARGKEYADALAVLLWAPRAGGEAEAAAPKSAEALTPEEWAQYGVGAIIDHDANGVPIYEDYRLPAEVQSAPAAPLTEVDGSWLALVTHWRLVVAELLARGINLHHPDVLDGPWLSVRAAIFDLLDSPTRLREVLTRR